MYFFRRWVEIFFERAVEFFRPLFAERGIIFLAFLGLAPKACQPSPSCICSFSYFLRMSALTERYLLIFKPKTSPRDTLYFSSNQLDPFVDMLAKDTAEVWDLAKCTLSSVCSVWWLVLCDNIIMSRDNHKMGYVLKEYCLIVWFLYGHPIFVSGLGGGVCVCVC